MKMNRGSRQFWILALCVCAFFFIFFIFYPKRLRPKPTGEWVHLHPGVSYKVWNIRGHDPDNRSRAMAIRVNLRNPAVRVVHRSFSPGALERGRHFILSWADLEIRKHPESIAILNTARYELPGFLDHFPGASVRALESVIVNGILSHRHAHSYLIWWSENGDLHFETRKPPPDPLPVNAWMGVGVQGIQVLDGHPQYFTLTDIDTEISRSFLGADPEGDVLWLMAFESVTGRRMIDEVLGMGIPYGGQVDSGNSTNLLMGDNLPGIRAYSGIRNIRPLAGYFVVEPVDE